MRMSTSTAVLQRGHVTISWKDRDSRVRGELCSFVRNETFVNSLACSLLIVKAYIADDNSDSLERNSHALRI